MALAAQNLIIGLRACDTAGGLAGGVTARAWERGGQIVSSSSQRWALQMQEFGHDGMRGSHITLRIILGDRNSQEQGARNSEGHPRCHGEETPPLSWLLHSSKIAQAKPINEIGLSSATSTPLRVAFGFSHSGKQNHFEGKIDRE